MALVIDLKPGEKILIGEAVITNDSQRTRLHIAGEAPILREKDVMQEDEADTPCKKIYFLVQCMYLSNDMAGYTEQYFTIVNEVQAAAASLMRIFMEINQEIITGRFYKALKLCKKLIEHEDDLLNYANENASSEVPGS